MYTVTATILRSFDGHLTGHLRSVDAYGSTYDRPIDLHVDAQTSTEGIAALLTVPAGAQVKFALDIADLRFHGWNVRLDEPEVGVLVLDFDFDSAS